MTSKHSIGHFHWIVLKHLSRHNTERYVDGVEVAIDCKTTGRRLVHWASSLLIISACGLQDAGSIDYIETQVFDCWQKWLSDLHHDEHTTESHDNLCMHWN